jgi:hypothetical protein
MLDVPDHRCLICNINYSSKQSLCNHNKKFHRNNNSKNNQNLANVNHNLANVNHNLANVNYNIIICKWCNKVLSCRQSKYRHQLICKDNKLKEENLLLKKENEKLKIINNNCNNNIINNNNINNDNRQIINNNNNIYKINFVINKNGSENLEDLTEEEIKQILLRNGEGITKFIELLNFNKELPQNHTFCTTNIKDKYLNVYNTDTNTVEKDRKKYFFDNLIKNSVDGIKKLIELHKKEKYIVDNNNIVKEMLKSSIEFGSKFLNDKILKELFNRIDLLSYNNKKIIKNTWIGNSNLINYILIRRVKKLILKITNKKDKYDEIFKSFIKNNNKNTEKYESLMNKYKKINYSLNNFDKN